MLSLLSRGSFREVVFGGKKEKKEKTFGVSSAFIEISLIHYKNFKS